jgi:uncharacterized protein (TIRG00374 family)
MRKHLWIGVLFAIGCLYFAFRGISLQVFWTVLMRARPGPIIVAVMIYFIGYYLRSVRWAILLRPVCAVPPKDLFWPMIIGFFANNVLPLRMGELVRAHISGTKCKISRTASLGTILLERVCDTLSFLTTFLVASLFYPFPHYMEKGAWLLGGACLLVIVLLILIRFHEATFHEILAGSPLPAGWKTRIRGMTAHFIHSTSGITQPRYVIEAMILSLIIWVIEGTFLYLMAHAFVIDLKYAGAFFLLFALGLSVTLPQAPGYVGTFELFGATALSLLGIPKSQGLPVVLAIHGTQFMLISLMGVIGLWREGLSFHNLTSTTPKSKAD